MSPFTREAAALHQLEGELRTAVNQLRRFADTQRSRAERPSVYDMSAKDFEYGWHAGIAFACDEAADSVQKILADVEKFHERQAS